MKAPGLVFICLLGMCGCGRHWERFWGQDTKPEVRYIELRPSVDVFDVKGDHFVVIVLGIDEARYLSVYAVDEDGARTPLPYTNEVQGVTATYYIGSDSLEFYHVATALGAGFKHVEVQYVM